MTKVYRLTPYAMGVRRSRTEFKVGNLYYHMEIISVEPYEYGGVIVGFRLKDGTTKEIYFYNELPRANLRRPDGTIKRNRPLGWY